jgi:hypothetical protein
MKNFHPTRNQFRQMFRPKAPHPDTALLKKMTSDILELKAMTDEQKPEVHQTQHSGVYYQLHEQQKPKKRMMGFREWCEKH